MWIACDARSRIRPSAFDSGTSSATTAEVDPLATIPAGGINKRSCLALFSVELGVQIEIPTRSVSTVDF